MYTNKEGKSFSDLWLPTMVVTGQPPPGGGPGQGPGGQHQLHLQSQVKPGQTFAGAAMAASGTVPGGRSWQQIFNDAKQKRNILEIHIDKNIVVHMNPSIRRAWLVPT